jgi:hypothetical protein
MPRGPFQGEELDISEKRSTRLLTPEQSAAFGAGPRDMVIRDFLHEGKFWVAKIPVDQVEQVYYHYIDTHVQLSFKFKEGHPVRLYPQSGSVGTVKEERTLDEIVHTLDPRTVNGDPFVAIPQRRLFRNFATAYRFLSPKDSYVQWILRRPHTGIGERIPVDFSEAEREEKLRFAIERSEKLGHDPMFNFVLNNCTTGACEVLDRGHRYTLLQKLAGSFRFLSPKPYTRLWLMGLISKKMRDEGSPATKINDLYRNDEVRNDPAYRAGIRRYVKEMNEARKRDPKSPEFQRYGICYQIAKKFGLK